ncbi:MAG: MMPL family transporter, partial [Clostridiales bacterium]|nr:MMPL family transporter [Clostridiales bacterium]
MLSRLSVKRPYTVVVAVIMVLILGTISFINLKTDLLPNIDLPYLLIMTNYPGASPEEVEMAVTKPIEQVVATTSNIKNISSISSENSSTVILEFNNDVNMDSSVIEINGMLDLIKPAWNDSIGSPMLMRLNPDMMPIMIASVDVKDTDIIDISQLVSQSIIPELESVNGVASVSGAGLIEEKIEVLIDNSKIDDLNKRVLDAVDSELLEAEDKLADAKKEIEDGKSKLKSEEKKQNARLLEGEKALTAAKQQMTEAEMQMDAGRRELERAQSELRGKLDEVTKQEKELNALKSRLEGLSSMIPEMGEDEIKAIIGGILAGLPKEIKDRMGSDLLAIRKRLEEGGLVMPDEAGSLITEISNRLNESLEMISAGKTELEKGLEEISKKIEELDDSKALLASKKEEMGKKEQELTVGKLMLTIEMDKAKDKLEIGEATLEEKMEEFETARDQAFKKASLDGVITSDMIAGILVAQNFSMPAGSVSEEGTDYLVKVGDKFKDIDELQRLMLFDTGDKGIGKIYLEDVADVSKIDNSDETYAKVNGNNAVMLTFQKQSGFATAEVAESLRERFEKISEENKGLNITPLMDQGVYIDIVVDSVLSNVIYGGILAILILLLFLKDIKPTFIIAVSIPISLIFAIAMMYFTGVNINIISLAGLALGVGMLVDNSIVAIENIYRLRNEGKSAIEASIEGAGEIAGAIIASTLTTVCVFLPIVFVKGISRQLFVDMGLTIAYSLIASLIVALTLVPTMASRMLKKTNEKRNKTFDWFSKRYLGVLKWSLKHGVIVVVSVVILLGLSIYLGLSMGTAFIPTMEAPQMSVSIKIPDEDPTGDIVALSDTVIDRIMGIEGIETIGAFQGGGSGGSMAGALGAGMFGGGSGRTSNLDSMNLYLLLDENKRITNAEIENQIYGLTRDLDCEINVRASDMNISALAGSGIEVIVKGKDLDTLQDIAGDVAGILRDTEGAVEVSEGSDNALTEVRIVVDKEKAMENGLTIAQVFSNINSAISKGKSATALSGLDKDYPIIVIDKAGQDMNR